MRSRVEHEALVGIDSAEDMAPLPYNPLMPNEGKDNNWLFGKLAKLFKQGVAAAPPPAPPPPPLQPQPIIITPTEAGSRSSCCGGCGISGILCIVFSLVIIVGIILGVSLTVTSMWTEARTLSAIFTGGVARVAQLQSQHKVLLFLDASGNVLSPAEALADRTRVLSVLSGSVETHSFRLDWSLKMQSVSTNAWAAPTFRLSADRWNSSTQRLEPCEGSPYALGAEVKGSRVEELPRFLNEEGACILSLIIHSSVRDWIVPL
jgi:hypothetical protein